LLQPKTTRTISNPEKKMAAIFSPIDSHVPPNFIVDVHSVLSGEQFDQLVRDNPELRMELTAKGELILMSPTGSKTGALKFQIARIFGNWVESDRSGIGFDSSTLFVLPNGARRSPDVSWIKRERWETLTAPEQEGFSPICPDFVIELRSRSDNLPPLEDKMLEYIANGARMAWLIDPLRKRVYIYRPNLPAEILGDPETVTGDPELPGFVLNLSELWVL
jgi:Uma2 family endonuclease